MGTNTRYRRRMWRQAIAILIGFGILFFAVFHAGKIGSPATHLKAWFENPGGGKSSKYWLELAKTEGERSKGLMFRKELPSDGGMIFIYPDSRILSFWMKNTLIPLDMIFVTSDYRVAGVLHNVPAMTTELRRIEKMSQFVVELAGGKAAAEGITAGSVMKFDGEMPKTKE